MSIYHLSTSLICLSVHPSLSLSLLPSIYLSLLLSFCPSIHPPHPKIKLNTTFMENCMLNYFTSTIFTYQLVCLRLFLSIANLSSNSGITSSSNHCQLKWLLFLERFLRHESTPEGLVLPLLMICDMTGDKAKGNLPFSAASSSSSSIASLLLLPTSLTTVN